MSINLTDEIEVKTKKGKLGAAKQIFLEGDTQTVENEIQDINSRHNDLNSKHESLSSTVSEHTNQIESNQNQITANKSTQDAKNTSLDANMAKLNTRDDQITELVRGIAATGGASVATTVTYDNTSSHLASATVQGAIDELQGSKIDKTSILQESGDAENKVMSQKATSSAIKAETQERNKADEGLNAKLSELKRTISYIEEYGVEYFTTGQVATPPIQAPFLPLTDDMVTITVRGFINNLAQIAINIAEDYDKPIKRLAANVIDIDGNNCYNYTFKKSDYPAATRLYVSKGDGSYDEFCKITVNKGIISSKELSENIESVNTKLTEYKNSNDSRLSDLENADIVINEDISSLDSRVKELETKGEDLIPYGEGGLSNGSANELSAQLLTEEFNPSRNWYIEFVAKVNTTRNNKIFAIDWGKNKNFAVIYLRHLTAPQFTLDDTNYANFNTPISWTNNEYAHYMLAKNGTGISLFCNGILLQSVEYTATYSPSINKLHIALYTKNNFKLFRIGYYEVFDSLVSHYNNGNPFAFVEDKSNMIAEFLPENLTKTKATNTANGISLEYEEGKYEPIVDNPWANPIKAEGSPVNVPLYSGQHYLDTITNIMYEAIGNTQVTDWKKSGNPTFDDLDSLKEEIIEIGDRRWSGGSGGGSTAVVVTDYYKDGITEDSDAIEAAIEAAKNFGKVLYFPNGIYKLRRSIQLWNNAVIDGDKGAVLTHKAVDGNGCIMTTLSSATVIGDTTISVSSVAGLSIGDEIVIYDTTSGLSSYQETMCKITAINGNTLTIDATQWHGSVGVRRAYHVANTRITTDFALIHTPWVDGAHNCVIRNITLQANGNNNEPYVYSQSPIHIHSKNAYDISIKNIVVDGSVNDGISIQGSSKQRVIGCTIKGIKWKGVHWGTTSADVLVERCWFENCGLVASDGNAYNSGGGAIYSCYNNHKLRIVNNHITDCLRGVFGLDVQNSNSGEDGSWVVSGNVFDTPKNFTNRAGLGISVGGSNNGLITNNIFCRFGKNSTPITIDNSEDFGGNTFAVTISNNTFGHWQSNYVGDDNKGAIYVKGATKCIVNGNNIDNHYHDYGSTAAPTEISGNTNIIVDSCTKCVVTNNIVAGGKVEEKNTNTGCVIANNVVDIVE